MNNINLTGRITKDPELKETSNGVKYARFTIAVSRIGAKEGAQKADFIPCIAWKKTAEILCQYCVKGQMLGVNGRLSAEMYEKDGEKKTAYEVIALSLEMIGGKPESKPQEAAPVVPTTKIESSTDSFIEDVNNIELPFEL